MRVAPIVASMCAVLGACSTSSGPPSQTTVTTAPDEPTGAKADVGVPFDRVGALDGCNPVGQWHAVGTWRGVGNCPAAQEPVSVDIEVVRGSTGFRMVPPAGAEGRGDSLAASDGACALSLELHYRLEARDHPNIILFADLVEGGKSAATWDEYEPTAAGVVFSPDTGTIRCSDALDVVVEAVTRAATTPSSSAPPKVRNEHH